MSQLPQPSMTPFGYESIYSAPRNVVSSMLEGEATLSGGMAALFAQDRLTPAERTSDVRQRLESITGDSSVSKALWGVVTNPWVWLFAVTSPIGGKAAGEMFRSASKYTSWVADRFSVFKMLGLTNIRSQLGERTNQLGHRVGQVHDEVMNLPQVKAVFDAENALIARNGLDAQKGLRWQEYADGDTRKQIARDIGALVYAKRNGYMDATKRLSLDLDDAGKLMVKESKEVAARFQNRQQFDELVKQYGAEEFMGSVDTMMTDLAKRMVEKPERFFAFARGVQTNNGAFQDVNKMAVAGEKERLLFKRLKDLDPNNPEHLKEVQDSLVRRFVEDKFYMPRNTREYYRDGKILDGKGISQEKQVRPAGLIFERTAGEVAMHPEDLAHMAKLIDNVEDVTALPADNKIRQMWEKGKLGLKGEAGQAGAVYRADVGRSLDKYVQQYAHNEAMYLADVGDLVRAADRNQWDDYARQGTKIETTAEFDEGISYATPIAEAEKRLKGGITLADLLGQDYVLAQGKYNKDLISHVVVPHLMGLQDTSSTAVRGSVLFTKQLARNFSEGAIGKSIAGTSEWGKRFVQKLGQYGNSDDLTTVARTASELQYKTSQLLYSSHLGINIGSALINLTQPLLFAGSWVGYADVLAGYGKAFQRLGGYFSDRMKLGLKVISEEQRNVLIKKHFGDLTAMRVGNDTRDLLEIGESGLQLYEGVGMGRRIANAPETMWDKFFHGTMSLFQKAEWVNRTTTAEAALSVARRQGLDPANTLLFADRVVKTSQFGGHWMDQPIAFLSGSQKIEGVARVAHLAQNPLLRQLLSFPTRTLVTAFETVPRLAGREGLAGFTGFLNDMGRGMAMSALMWEIGKETLGVDLARAGMFAATTDALPFMSQGRVDTRDSVLPLPPIIDIPVAAIKKLYEDGTGAAIAESLPRLVPGGVALQRAFSVAPEMAPPLKALLGQKQYANWGQQMPDGSVPIYREDGTLLRFDDPKRMVYRALGVDLGAWNQPSQLDNWLVKNRDQIVGYQHEYMRSMLGNNPSAAEGVAREFERRYRLPLTVTKDQWRSFIDARTTPRTGRVLERVNPQVRAQFQQAAAGANPLNLQQEPIEELQRGMMPHQAYEAYGQAAPIQR